MLHIMKQLQMKWHFIMLSSLFLMLLFTVESHAFVGGDGSEANPYQIATPEDLNAIRNEPDASYILVSDIDMSGSSIGNWTPIPTFSGTLDGQGFAVQNFTCSHPNDTRIGMFVYLDSAEIIDMNLHISGSVQGESQVGALAVLCRDSTRISGCHVIGNVEGARNTGGFVYSMTDDATLENCTMTGDVTCAGDLAGGLLASAHLSSVIESCSVSGHVNGVSNIGGFVGNTYNSVRISNSSFSGDVVASYHSAGGFASTNIGTIRNCTASGSVTSRFYVGGFVGANSNGGEITECSSSCTVQRGTGGEATGFGGFAGWNTGSTISKCYSTGNVNGSRVVGGFVGRNLGNGSISDCYSTGDVDAFIITSVGGFVGYNDVAQIRRSYCTGTVLNAVSNNNFTGDLNSGTVGLSYFLADTNSDSPMGNGRVSEDMMKEDNYVTWNFSSTWHMLEGYTYPSLEPLSFSGSGKGTAASPYIIMTKRHLLEIELDRHANYRMGQDIDLSGDTSVEGWMPLCLEAVPFTGDFDGDGHSVTGLYSNQSRSNVGLFCHINGGSVRNLSVAIKDGFAVQGLSYAGGVAGRLGNGTIDGCSITGVVRSGSSSGGIVGSITTGGKVLNCDANVTVVTTGSVAGGIAGRSNGGTVSNSSFMGSVSGGKYLGGITGFANNSEFTDVMADGTITGDGWIGGILGWSDTSDVKQAASNCWVEGTGNCVGQIAGIFTNAEMTETTSAGYVEGVTMVGGMAGNIQNSLVLDNSSTAEVSGTTLVGGLIGYFGGEEGTLMRCFSGGRVLGNNDVGGLIGRSLHAITESYYDNEATGQDDTGKGLPKTSDEMVMASTYSGWDLNGTWDIDQGSSYPYLRHLGSPVVPPRFTCGIEDGDIFESVVELDFKFNKDDWNLMPTVVSIDGEKSVTVPDPNPDKLGPGIYCLKLLAEKDGEQRFRSYHFMVYDPVNQVPGGSVASNDIGAALNSFELDGDATAEWIGSRQLNFETDLDVVGLISSEYDNRVDLGVQKQYVFETVGDVVGNDLTLTLIVRELSGDDVGEIYFTGVAVMNGSEVEMAFEVSGDTLDFSDPAVSKELEDMVELLYWGERWFDCVGIIKADGDLDLYLKGIRLE